MLIQRVSLLPNRRRRYKPKGTTGCSTCKIRRIKCDETKPHCRECTRTGRKCDGYIPVSAPTTPSEDRSALKLDLRYSSPSSSIGSIISFDIPGTETERLMFDFFRTRTVPQLSGFLDSDFWHRLLLQAAYHEPAIRHAAIAVAALHGRFEVGDNTILKSNTDYDAGGFALEQYVKAIGLLVDPERTRQEKLGADVALMSCVLFICFETIRGHLRSALSHIDCGVKIIAEMDPKTPVMSTTLRIPSIPYASIQTLNLIFIRLDTQASSVLSGRGRNLLPQNLDDSSSGYHPRIPMIFSSLGEAHNALDNIWTHHVPAAQDIETTNPDIVTIWKLSSDLNRNKAMVRLRQWSVALEAFIHQQGPKMDKAMQLEIHILKMYRIFAGIDLSVDRALPGLGPDEMDWDNYVVQFEAVLTHAENFINLSTLSSPRIRPLPTFSLDKGVIFPLYFVATKVRHRGIRRRAIELLENTVRKEGIWSSDVAAKVARRLMQLEEDGLAVDVDIPRWKRLAGVRVQPDLDGRKVDLKYIRRLGVEVEDVLVMKVMEW